LYARKCKIALDDMTDKLLILFRDAYVY